MKITFVSEARSKKASRSMGSRIGSICAAPAHAHGARAVAADDAEDGAGNASRRDGLGRGREGGLDHALG